MLTKRRKFFHIPHTPSFGHEAGVAVPTHLRDKVWIRDEVFRNKQLFFNIEQREKKKKKPEQDALYCIKIESLD